MCFSAAVCVLLALLVAPSNAHAQTKIAVVDLRGAMMQTEDGMSAAATLKRYMKNRQAELDRKQRDLQAEEQELLKQGLFLSRRSMQRRTEHWRLRVIEMQTKAMRYNKQLQQKEASLTKHIARKMMKVIHRVARKRGFDIVVDRGAAPYVRSDLDLTDMVVQMYNRGGSGGGSKGDKQDKGDKAPPPSGKDDAPAPSPPPAPAP